MIPIDSFRLVDPGRNLDWIHHIDAYKINYTVFVQKKSVMKTPGEQWHR